MLMTQQQEYIAPLTLYDVIMGKEVLRRKKTQRHSK